MSAVDIVVMALSSAAHLQPSCIYRYKMQLMIITTALKRWLGAFASVITYPSSAL